MAKRISIKKEKDNSSVIKYDIYGRRGVGVSPVGGWETGSRGGGQAGGWRREYTRYGHLLGTKCIKGKEKGSYAQPLHYFTPW